MKKIYIAIFLIVLTLVVGTSYYFNKNKISIYTGPESVTQEQKFASESQNVEFVGYNFIQNFINSAPPEPDIQAMQDAYESLSQNAKTQVSSEFISRDLAAFIGVQDIPDAGFSIEDLQFEETGKAKYIVGLNFSGGRVLKAINLIQEDGQWKVDGVDTLEQYP